jgi:hypothetical protein
MPPSHMDMETHTLEMMTQRFVGIQQLLFSYQTNSTFTLVTILTKLLTLQHNMFVNVSKLLVFAAQFS